MTTAIAIATPLRDYAAQQVLLKVEDGVAAVTLNRPERKNPLTFDSYAELVALFRAARTDESVKVFVLSGAGDNFSSGGDVLDIIGPLVAMKTADLLRFTEMTGDLVKAMRACPQPVIAAVDGVCAGAGAIMAMASDLRIATPESRSSSTASAWRAATWARAPSFRGSSGRAGRASCSTPAAR